MKQILLFASLFFSVVGFSQVTKTYNGNGKSGFGGAIGGSTLTVTDNGDSIIFSMTKGPGLFDSVLVFYLDASASGGLTSTSGLTASSDGYQAAVAGASTVSGGRAILNFPVDFAPDAAIALDKNGGQIFYFIGNLIIPATTFAVSPAGNNNAPEYTAAAKKSDLGASGPVAFKFLGTYIGPNASRSDEGFGVSFSGFSRVGRMASYNPYTIATGDYFVFSSILPVKLMDFKASKEKDGVSLNWSVAQESGIDAYEVQRSGNGVQFSTIKTVSARNASAPSTYSAKDNTPNAGGNYYRLAIRENGKYEYSKVVYISSDKGKGSLVANYQSGNSLMLSLNDVAAGTYRLSVLNYSGQIVHTAMLQHNGANTSEQINLQSNLSKGVYRVVLQSAKEKYVAAILVQ